MKGFREWYLAVLHVGVITTDFICLISLLFHAICLISVNCRPAKFKSKPIKWYLHKLWFLFVLLCRQRFFSANYIRTGSGALQADQYIFPFQALKRPERAAEAGINNAWICRTTSPVRVYSQFQEGSYRMKWGATACDFLCANVSLSEPGVLHSKSLKKTPK
jgi:hypothetical protein